MKNVNFRKAALISIFLISLSLRLTLCVINRQANDDHIEPIGWIVDKHQIPEKKDCWECFQPKSFYLLNAAIIKVFHIEGLTNRIISVQLVNFIFSFLILLFTWKFISRQRLSEAIKLSAFALVAFNPGLTGINVQATNDTLEILAGVCAIYFAFSFFENKCLRSGLWMTVSVIFAAIVKASGLVIIISLVFIFILKLFSGKNEERKITLKIFFVLLIAFILIVPFAGGYLQNYLQYDTPFVTNIPKADRPISFYEEDWYSRPGITSVVYGYFTFRFFDMLKQPYIKNGTSPFVTHRTSLWSQLYGRTFFLHFDHHPMSWESLNPRLVNVGRILIALGLTPLFLFLWTYWKTGIEFIKNIYSRNKAYFSGSNDWIFFIFASAFFLFIIKYTCDYRDFSTMKSIFVFPALPAFIALFMKGYSGIKSRWIMRFTIALILMSVLFSIYDISFLIKQLW